jgi:hypothetical protein
MKGVKNFMYYFASNEISALFKTDVAPNIDNGN